VRRGPESEEELALGMAENDDIQISRSTVNRTLRRLKLTLEEPFVARERETERVKDLRRKFCEHQPEIDAARPPSSKRRAPPRPQACGAHLNETEGRRSRTE
jgi:hypothetical protein